jgi:acyl-CoA synthetase (AMP-forming)/AMP-acid ligase II
MNIGHLVTKSSQHFARNVALVFQDRIYTYKEVNERVNKLANSLAGLSLKRGDRVGLLLYNCSQFIESDFALAKAGLVRVTLNPRLSADDHRYMINDSEANTLIFESCFTDTVLDLARTTGTLKNLICVDRENSDFINYEGLIKNGSTEEPSVVVEGDDIYALLYTSGTSGKPKGVTLTHKNFLSTAYNLLMERDVRSGDRMLHVGPLTHASGIWVLPHYARGAVNYIHKRFDVEMLLKTIEEQKITTVMMVPTMILRLLSYPGVENYDLGSLRSVIYGGSPMPVEKLKEAILRFGDIFSQNYGQTEAPTTITYLPREDHKIEGLPEDRRKLSSAGRPYVRVQVKVVNRQGLEVKPGEKGEIIVKGDHVMKGYWKNEQATREKIVNGWLNTGDIAIVDEEGYLYIVDRKNDLIISGGFNIYPREIEEVIYSYPGVEEVAVIGVPDENWVEAVKALVVLKKGQSATESELISFCKDKLARLKAPKSVEFVDCLPKNSYGKVMKRELRERYLK